MWASPVQSMTFLCGSHNNNPVQNMTFLCGSHNNMYFFDLGHFIFFVWPSFEIIMSCMLLFIFGEELYFGALFLFLFLFFFFFFFWRGGGVGGGGQEVKQVIPFLRTFRFFLIKLLTPDWNVVKTNSDWKKILFFFFFFLLLTVWHTKMPYDWDCTD